MLVRFSSFPFIDYDYDSYKRPIGGHENMQPYFARINGILSYEMTE